MRAQDFIQGADPENLWEPPTPPGWTVEEVLTGVVNEISDGRARLLAHYRDWYAKEGVPLIWDQGRMFLARNASGQTLELHVNAPRADAKGMKTFATVLMRSMPYERRYDYVEKSPPTGYKSRAASDRSTGEVEDEQQTRTTRVFLVPEGAEAVLITTTDPDITVEYRVNGTTGSYGEVAEE